MKYLGNLLFVGLGFGMVWQIVAAPQGRALQPGDPGDGVTAILIGGFTIHGLQPRPLLLSKEPDLVAMIYAAFLLGTLMLLAIQLATIRVFPRAELL